MICSWKVQLGGADCISQCLFCAAHNPGWAFCANAVRAGDKVWVMEARELID